LEAVLILRSGPFGRVSKDERYGLSWFETALKKRLLTMRTRQEHT
jgi:hypothetical protein